MKNYYWGAFLVTALVLIILLALNLLPDYQLFGHKMRRVDMLSELRYDKPVAALSEDTVKLEEIVEKKEIITDYVDTCEAGVTCIVDYSDSTHRGMSHFYAVLDSVADLDRPVRIAVFGDSFIEGDIFTADLREMLQQHYGGKGVGYVNITSNVANFRPTVIHKFEGWQSHSVIDSICDRAMLGLNSTYYKPRTPQAFVSLTGNAETNILACLTAKRLGVRKTIAMVENIDYVKMAESLDIGTIINKKAIAASHIYQMMLDSDVKNTRFLMTANADVAEFTAQEGSKVTRKKVFELGLPHGTTIGGLVRGGEGHLVSGGSQIEAGDIVVVFCHNVNMSKIEKYFI